MHVDHSGQSSAQALLVVGQRISRARNSGIQRGVSEKRAASGNKSAKKRRVYSAHVEPDGQLGHDAAASPVLGRMGGV